MKPLLMVVVFGWLMILTEPGHAALIIDVNDVPDSGRIPDSIDDPPGPGQAGDVTYILDDLVFGSVEPVDTVFTIQKSGGTSEYLIDQIFEFDQIGPLGPKWSGFRFELGTGTGGSFEEAAGPEAPQFILPNPSDHLDPANSADVGDRQWLVSVSASNPALLVWGGGDTFLADGNLEIAFLINIPDYNGISSTGNFTLRQTPVVLLLPEPTSGFGILLGLAMMMGRHRKRQAVNYSPANQTD